MSIRNRSSALAALVAVALAAGGLVTGTLATRGLMAAAPFPPDSPVADAAERGDLAQVRALLSEGADVNAAQGDGMTALHWAALGDRAEMIRVLVYAGANTETRTRLGSYTPLHLAAENGHAEAIAALVAGEAKIGAQTANGTTPLHFAAASGDAEAVTLLLDAGAEIDAPEWASSQTPLMFAAAHGRVETARVLVARGADLGLATEVVDYVARSEADREDEERREALVDAQRKIADPTYGQNAEDEDEEEEAAGQGAREPAAQREAARAAPPDPAAELRGKDGAEKPPVDESAEPAEGEAAEAEAAAAEPVSDPAAELRGKDGALKPVEGAEAAEADSMAEMPAEAVGADSMPGEMPAEEAGEAEAAAGQGEEAGEEKSEEDPDEPKPMSYTDLVGKQGGLSALHYAAREGHLPIVQELLAAGADINSVTGGDHSTPLLVAIINGHYDLAMFLLEQGADPDIRSEDGAGPLFATLNNRWAPKALYPQPTAFKQQRTSYLELMEVLLEAGADPNVRLEQHIWYTSFNFDLLGVNFQGATPFWRAAYATDVPAMQLLLTYGADPSIPTVKPPERRRRRTQGAQSAKTSAPTDGQEAEEEEEETDPSGLPPVPVGGPAVFPVHAASGVGYGQEYAANAHRHAPDGWLPAVKFLIEELGMDVNARDHQGYTALHHAASRGDNELIEYLVSKGADVMVVSREGQTTVDMANGPQQRVQPFPETIALLESLGAINNHNCVSC